MGCACDGACSDPDNTWLQAGSYLSEDDCNARSPWPWYASPTIPLLQVLMIARGLLSASSDRRRSSALTLRVRQKTRRHDCPLASTRAEFSRFSAICRKRQTGWWTREDL